MYENHWANNHKQFGELTPKNIYEGEMVFRLGRERYTNFLGFIRHNLTGPLLRVKPIID